MKVTMVLVASLNGKITKGDEPNIHSWASKEDFKFFSSLRDKYNLIIMGRKTYETVRDEIELTPKRLRIVLTKEPSKYVRDVVNESLEFTKEDPKELLRRLSSKGYKNALIVGGSEINSLFLKSDLVDELYVTIEPKVFGSGKPLFAEGEFESIFKLIRVEKLNKRGTINLKYKTKR